MKSFAFFLIVLVFASFGLAQTAQESRIAEIQAALQKEGLDGWLFYDFRGSDILTPRILKTERMGGTRRWFYYVPAKGEPVKVVHAIEQGTTRFFAGRKLVYREWQLLNDQVKAAMSANGKPKRIAMQYSPNNDIPYISRVDAGTIEMVRSLGVKIESSADLVQQFEAVWTPEQLAMHTEGAAKMQKIMLETFAEIKRRINAEIPTTEIDVQQFMMKRFGEEGMNPSPMDVSVTKNAACRTIFRPKSAIRRSIAATLF
jgi:Xaa-Pro aminopeptidase